MLRYVELLTHRKFLGTIPGEAGKKQFFTEWFDFLLHGWFSNRPWPAQSDGTPPVRRVLSLGVLPEMEIFFRVDLELKRHGKPSDYQVAEAIRLGQQAGAIGAIRTPRGVHLYVLTSRPCTYEEFKEFVKIWYAPLEKDSLVICSATWTRNNLSRFVPELEFYNPAARMRIDAVMEASFELKKKCSPFPIPSGPRGTSTALVGKNAQQDSEGPKHHECSQIMGALLRSKTAEQIIPKLIFHTVAELYALIHRTQTDPDYKLDGDNTTGTTHEWFPADGENATYWSTEMAQIGIFGGYSPSRAIQVCKSVRSNFGHTIQPIWNSYRRRWRVASEEEKEIIRNEAIGTALNWFDQSTKAAKFRLWFTQQFPGHNSKGVSYGWLAAHADIERLWKKYGPGAKQNPVGKYLKIRLLDAIATGLQQTPVLARKLHYCERQIRRGLLVLAKEGKIQKAGTNRNQKWFIVQSLESAEENGFSEKTNPDLHRNPQGEKGEERVLISLPLPRPKSSKGMSTSAKRMEMGKRDWLKAIRRLKQTSDTANLERLLSLPASDASKWANDLPGLKRNWRSIRATIRKRVALETKVDQLVTEATEKVFWLAHLPDFKTIRFEFCKARWIARKWGKAFPQFEEFLRLRRVFVSAPSATFKNKSINQLETV